jgi:phytoene/squalene synthetase
MLRLFKQYNENNAALSDCICTGLQLINFWQDLSIDIKNKRYYIPKEELNSFNVDIQDLQNAIKSINLRNCISSILKYTDTLFSQGSDLVSELKGIRFKFEIALTFSGGKKILDKLYRLNDNLLYIRPKLTKKDYLNIIINALKLVF